MSKYIGSPVVSLSTDTVDVTGDITTTDATPEVIIVNNTHEDTDGGREGKVTFKGQQSGGEETTLAQIQASHDGTSDDEKGDLIFKVNDGSDGASPTERLRIGSDGATTITTEGNEDTLTLVSTSANAFSGPTLSLYRNSASPADADVIGVVAFNAENDADEIVNYSSLKGFISDASDGTEDGQLNINTIVDGTSRQRVKMDSTETVFNEEGIDLDFRVEGDSNTTALFVQGSDNRVGIGVGDPDAALDVSKGTNALGIIRATQRLTGAAAYGLDIGLDPSTGDPVFSRIVNDTVTESFRIVRSNGEVDIGQHSHTSDFMLQIASSNLSGTRGGISVQNKTDNTGGYFLGFYRSNNALIGNISQGSGSVAYNTTSDYRLKENVNYSFDATTRLKQLKPCIFNWIDDEDNTPVDGFLAHEVSSVVPEAVTGKKDATEEIGIIKDSNGNTIREKASKQSDLDEGDTWTATGTQPVYQGIDQSKLVPLLVKTIQELEARITVLEGE